MTGSEEIYDEPILDPLLGITRAAYNWGLAHRDIIPTKYGGPGRGSSTYWMNKMAKDLGLVIGAQGNITREKLGKLFRIANQGKDGHRYSEAKTTTKNYKKPTKPESRAMPVTKRLEDIVRRMERLHIGVGDKSRRYVNVTNNEAIERETEHLRELAANAKSVGRGYSGGRLTRRLPMRRLPMRRLPMRYVGRGYDNDYQGGSYDDNEGELYEDDLYEDEDDYEGGGYEEEEPAYTRY